MKTQRRLPDWVTTFKIKGVDGKYLICSFPPIFLDEIVKVLRLKNERRMYFSKEEISDELYKLTSLSFVPDRIAKFVEINKSRLEMEGCILGSDRSNENKKVLYSGRRFY